MSPHAKIEREDDGYYVVVRVAGRVERVDGPHEDRVAADAARTAMGFDEAGDYRPLRFGERRVFSRHTPGYARAREGEGAPVLPEDFLALRRWLETARTACPVQSVAYDQAVATGNFTKIRKTYASLNAAMIKAGHGPAPTVKLREDQASENDHTPGALWVEDDDVRRDAEGEPTAVRVERVLSGEAGPGDWPLIPPKHGSWRRPRPGEWLDVVRLSNGRYAAVSPAKDAASEKPGEHECTDCKPFARVERDPKRMAVCMARAKKIGPIDSARAVYDLVHDDLDKLDTESFYVVGTDIHHQLRTYACLAQGQRHTVTVDPEDVVQLLALERPDHYFLVHNHPSTKAEASEDDLALTKSIRSAAEKACPSAKYQDHVIVGHGEFYSVARARLTRV